MAATTTDDRTGPAAFLAPAPGSVEARLAEATDTCVRRSGAARLTVDDIATEAGLSRATVYRHVPGGKDALLELSRRYGVATFFAELIGAADAEGDVEDRLAALVSTAARMLRDDEDLQRRLVEQRGETLTMFEFDGMDRILAAARVFLPPALRLDLPRREAGRVAELLARLVLCHELPDDSPVDLTDPDVARAQVRRRILPLLSRPVPGGTP